MISCLGGGLIPANLPRLQGYEDNAGRRNYCAAGLIGACGFDDSTCYFRRVDSRDVTTEFAAAFCQQVGPALGRINPSQQQQQQGGQQNGGNDNGGAGRYGGGGGDRGRGRQGRRY